MTRRERVLIKLVEFHDSGWITRDELDKLLDLLKTADGRKVVAVRMRELRAQGDARAEAREAAKKRALKRNENLGMFVGWAVLILILGFLVVCAVSVSRIPKDSPFWEENDRRLEQLDQNRE
jgi:hypothetical protein